MTDDNHEFVMTPERLDRCAAVLGAAGYELRECDTDTFTITGSGTTLHLADFMQVRDHANRTRRKAVDVVKTQHPTADGVRRLMDALALWPGTKGSAPGAEATGAEEHHEISETQTACQGGTQSKATPSWHMLKFLSRPTAQRPKPGLISPTPWA